MRTKETQSVARPFQDRYATRCRDAKRTSWSRYDDSREMRVNERESVVEICANDSNYSQLLDRCLRERVIG